MLGVFCILFTPFPPILVSHLFDLSSHFLLFFDIFPKAIDAFVYAVQVPAKSVAPSVHIFELLFSFEDPTLDIIYFSVHLHLTRLRSDFGVFQLVVKIVAFNHPIVVDRSYDCMRILHQLAYVVVPTDLLRTLLAQLQHLSREICRHVVHSLLFHRCFRHQILVVTLSASAFGDIGCVSGIGSHSQREHSAFERVNLIFFFCGKSKLFNYLLTCNYLLYLLICITDEKMLRVWAYIAASICFRRLKSNTKCGFDSVMVR
mmetsp:Transcript_92863/g.144844  ORF Transcript_92863/g.144844 Transcript_92863/m.144844 type:complete len:259 (+) Transcript_92863:873-1649(+)